MKKICSKCFIEKDINFFHKNRHTKDGYVSHCKICRKIKSKIDYEKNKNKDKKIIKSKICSTCFIDKDISLFHKHLSSKDGYRSCCKECRSYEFKKTYSTDEVFYYNHKKRSKEWRIKNKDKYNNYFKERYKKIPHVYAWRGMLNSVIRRIGLKKEKKTIEILGYSAEDLKLHIESLFLENMSWGNWGKWHIDHIKPLSSFSKGEDPKKVNALKNLQPLWAIENIIKSNKF